MRVPALLLVLALCACGGQKPSSTSALPVGVWEVADPESAARDLLPTWRGFYGGGIEFSQEQYAPRSDEEISAEQVPILRSLLVEFRADGTAASASKIMPWSTATWKREGDSITLTVDKVGPHVSGDVRDAPPWTMAARVIGDSLEMEFFEVPVRMRRLSQGPLKRPK